MIKCKNQYLPLKILLFSGKGLVCAMIVLGSSLTSFGQIAIFQNITADDGLPKVSVIPQDIGKILHNLFNNTFYACPEQSRSTVNEKAKTTPQPPKRGEKYTPTISVSSLVTKSPSGDLGVEISVQDNSPGIPDAIKGKIFQPFFTTKPTGSGTGLGLSLSYDIVKAHGGELKVESKETEGSEFQIIIPV